MNSTAEVDKVTVEYAPQRIARYVYDLAKARLALLKNHTPYNSTRIKFIGSFSSRKDVTF